MLITLNNYKILLKIALLIIIIIILNLKYNRLGGSSAENHLNDVTAEIL